MTTLTVEQAPVSQAVSRERAQRRPLSAATNRDGWSSPLVSDEARRQIDEELEELGARPLRRTHTSESVARKAIRMALREAGYEPADARAIAVEMVRAVR